MPLRGLFFKALLSRPGEAVELRAAVLLRNAPGGFDETLIFEAVKRGVQRSLLYLKDFTRQLPDPPGDRPPMQRLAANRFEDQQVERSLNQVDRLHRAFHMIIDIRESRIV